MKPAPHEKRGLPFAAKLTLAMLLVLAFSLSLGGAVLLMGNFTDTLEEASRNAEAQHLLQCYALESTLRDIAARGDARSEAQLGRLGTGLAE